ncbi:MAG: hypothetical protein JNK23_17195 [Opitutaceae bacterium]|nr:hypothetical protein [Opitutaceae bacterium]
MHRRVAAKLAFALVAGSTFAGCTGIQLAQSRPPPRPPVTDIARQERGEVITVRDTTIDLSTGRGRSVGMHSPAVPIGPVAVRVPVSVGGEKRVDAPAEEITVRLSTGKLMAVVQELSSPPFAPGERVRVLYERTDDQGGTGRIQIVRE